VRTRMLALAALTSLAAAAAAGAARAGAALPDLTASVDDVFVERDTSVVPGDVAEGCASATTGVDLLRFSTLTHNIGAADFPIGDPMCPDCDAFPGALCANPDFEFHCSPADGHGHGHYTNYAVYDLLDASEQVVATGGKLGFCLVDTSCDNGTRTFGSCDFQGLSAGCTDVYDVSLGCQYIEVTGLPDGAYTLRVTVDPRGEVDESNEANNAALFDVVLGDASTEPDEPLPGTSLRLEARRSGGTKLRLAAEPAEPLALPAAEHAPTEGGATLTVGDSTAVGNALSFDLPAARWEGLGKPPGASGWRFRGAKGDPCRKVRLGDQGLRARCAGAGLALPAAGPVEVVFTASGAKRYCATFGGTEKRNDAKRLQRVKAASADCPAP
jgi:hypothetical protein